LAHDIVRERPTLVGLSEDFKIIDERVSQAILRDTVHANLPEWRGRLAWLLSGELSEGQQRSVERRDWPQILEALVLRFISRAKEYELPPEELLRLLADMPTEFDIARFATAVYHDYQRSLAYRGSVDFSDLVLLALRALRVDPQYLDRLRVRWPYILEDEAQDSSFLQEQMLTLLTNNENWVRVGDPNQAINTTFTTSDPRYLRDFLNRRDVEERPLHTSGRSSQKIITLANDLLRWTVTRHPIIELREQTFYEQYIRPTEPGDTQPNPPNETSTIYIHPPDAALTPDKELDAVVKSLKQWLPDNLDKTVAVLVPENSRGFQLATRLEREDIPYEELLRSTTRTRQAATQLSIILTYLADPRQSNALARVYSEVWLPLCEIELDTSNRDDPPLLVRRAISRLKRVEEFITPSLEAEMVVSVLNLGEMATEWYEHIADFVGLIRRWLSALSLPIDQLVLTIGQELFSAPADVALAYKIAVLLRSVSSANPDWRLFQFVEELRVISENQRKFLGFDDAEEGYEPKLGRVTISTMHAAKGLEWDRVYLMAVNNYSFPSALDYDTFIGEKWFLRDELNIEAEALTQLKALHIEQPDGYSLGRATEDARLEYVAERLRLLYVGITRAKQDLSITWNTGRFWDRGGKSVKQPALPLVHLREFSDE
jgi:DNA helicase-2/ATP-dependent DNA helicase PcrA